MKRAVLEVCLCRSVFYSIAINNVLKFWLLLLWHCNRANDQWSFVSSWFISTGAEEWMNGVRKSICECINKNSGLNIVEGHQSLIIVHKDSNPWRSGVHCQLGWGLSSEGVLSLIPQAEEPVTMGRAYSDFPFALDRPACHTQVPVGLSSHLHLKDIFILFWG